MLRGGLVKRAAPRLSQILALLKTRFPLVLQILFVPGQHDRNLVQMLDVEDGIFQRGRIAEGVVVGDGVDDEESLTVLDVEVPHAYELLCSGSIQDLQGDGRVVDVSVFSVEIFDCRVVLLHKGPAMGCKVSL